ncbi:hypothetical protein ABD440_06030, partial [Chromobacterium piscinae]|uniref:hypothetical protein n=1 Tax=Chromobacterium piscinae TaxID=686831 RepID=UPI0031FD4396
YRGGGAHGCGFRLVFDQACADGDDFGMLVGIALADCHYPTKSGEKLPAISPSGGENGDALRIPAIFSTARTVC